LFFYLFIYLFVVYLFISLAFIYLFYLAFIYVRIYFSRPAGALGVIWSGLWLFLIYDSPSKHPRIDDRERHYIEHSQGLLAAAEGLLVVRCPSVCPSQHGPTAANPSLQVCCCGPGAAGDTDRSSSDGRMRAVLYSASDPGIQKPGDPVEPVTNELQMSTCV